MDPLSGIGGLGLQQPMLGLTPPMAAPAASCPSCGAPLDCFSASPELSEHPWLGGGGFEGLDAGLGFDPTSMFTGLDAGLPPGLELGGGSLANNAAAAQLMSVDQNLANSALIGAEAHGLKSGMQSAQIW